MLIEYTCKNCGKKFLAEHYTKRVYCSRECQNEYLKAHPDERHHCTNSSQKVEVICAECGKHEFVGRRRAEKYVCCSLECSGKHMKKIKSQKVEKICPVCGKHFFVKKSSEQRRVCCSKKCQREYYKEKYLGENNPNYRAYSVEEGIRKRDYKRYKEPYRNLTKDILGVKDIPKGYHIHHKDANENNHSPENLVVLPQSAHMLIHRTFGNILINALHTGKITRDTFFSLCTEEQKKFYEQIIDLNITNQAVVKQGELLEKPEEVNQQPSVYRNIYEGSTTNERVLTCNDEDSNFDTSALPTNKCGDDIV